MLTSLTLLFFFLPSIFSLRILVISPTVARSHVVFMGALADSLAEKGHTVHTIVIEVEKTDTNGTAKSDKIVFVPSTRPRSELHDLLKEDPFDESLEMLNIGVLLAIRNSLRLYAEDTVTQYDQYLKPLESPEGYDVGISENLGSLPLFLYRRLSVRRYILASAVGLSSIMAEAMGVPMPPSYVPNPLSSRVSTMEMSIIDRARYLIDYIFAPPIYRFICKAQLDYLRQFDPDLLDAIDSKAGSQFVAVNFPLLLDHLRPYTRHVVHVGGITLSNKKPKPIDKELASVVDQSAKGIVVISFGSLAETENLSDMHLKMFLEAFSRFPEYTFVWKFHVEREKHVQLFANYQNVHAVRWLPQHALLKHPKTLAFVSHCGANSVVEAANLGVPLIALPLFADQHYNGAAMLKKGSTVLLRKATLSEAAIVEALHKILHDERRMFACPFVNCHAPANSSESVFNAHLRLFHRNRTGEIVCRLCKFAEHFSTFTTWKNHMKRVHGNINSSSSTTPFLPPLLTPPLNDGNDESMGENEHDIIGIDSPFVSNESDNSSTSFEEMAHSLLSSFQAKLDGLPGVSHSLKDELFFVIHSLLNLCSEHVPSLPSIDSLMGSFKTKYLRQKRNVEDGFILPQPLHLGVEQELRRDRNGHEETVNVTSSAYTVPVEKSLRQLLSDPTVFDAVSSPIHFNVDYIESFLDSSIGVSLTQQATSLGCIPLPLTLFEDDAAAGNRNGGVSLRYMIYTIASLPLHLRSSHRCKLLFAVGKSKDLKKHGDDLLWKKWIEEIKGIDDPLEITRNGRTYKFLVRFVEVTGDNKALNALCGFRQCFSSGRFCRDCEIDYTELDSNVQLSTLQLRTLSRYDSAIGQLTSRKECVGIRSPCILNEIPGFHVTENVPHDLMHDGMEGIARIEIRRVVRVLSQQGISLSAINNRIKTFAYGRLDRSNKPEVISLTQVSLGQRAYQSLTMFRLLPWILRGLGELPPSFYSAYQLISLLLSPRFSRHSDLNLITELAEKYLEASLNGDENEEEEEGDEEEISLRRSSRIKPKQHFFLHYASSIFKNGPPRLNWSMTYESLLSFAKRVSYATCNYTNLPLTIASAYQRHLHYLRITPYDEITPTRPISTTEFGGLNYRGFEIRSNDFLVVSIGQLPLFGKVISFTRMNSEWSVTVRQYVTDQYVEKYNAYMVVETTANSTFTLCNVYSMQPLDGYGTDESDMLTVRRIDRGKDEVIYHGQSPLSFGTIRDLADYIATRQMIELDRVSVQDMYSGINLEWNEQIDLMRGYTVVINENHQGCETNVEPKREYALLEMTKVRSGDRHDMFNDSLSMDYDRSIYETRDMMEMNDSEPTINVKGVSIQGRTNAMIDEINPRNNNEMASKRIIPSSTSLALSGYNLKPELSSITMKDILKDRSECEQILREISNGSALEITPVRRCYLMRAVATYLLINCRNQYNPSYVEKLSFVTKIFQPYPQFDPVTLCQSGGAISKTISYSRRVLSANQLLQKRKYRKKESSVSDSLERQKDRLKELDSTPVGSEAYRSIMSQTRQYRLILLQSSVFEDILSRHSSLIVNPYTVIGDLESSDGFFSFEKFDSEWRTCLLPSLLSIGAADVTVDMDSLRNDCGGIDDLVGCLILLARINQTVVGESRKGKSSHFFSQFPSELTTFEVLERLRTSKIPFPSLFRIGCQSTIMVYLGDVCVPIPSLSVSQALVFIISLVNFTKLGFPRSYRIAARHLSSALAKYPEDPRHRFVAMVEFVAEYGDTLDRPLRLSPSTFFNIDVILVFLLFPIIIIYAIRKCCRQR